MGTTRKKPRIPARQNTDRTHISFRLHTDIYEKLRKEAQEKHVSMSDIVSQGIRRYVDWDLPAERFGQVSVPKPVIKLLYEKLDEDEAREVGRKQGEAMAEFVTFYYKSASLEKYLDLLDLQSIPSQITYEHTFNGKTHTVILRHNRGLRTSQSLGETLRVMMNTIGRLATIKETDEQVLVTTDKL